MTATTTIKGKVRRIYYGQRTATVTTMMRGASNLTVMEVTVVSLITKFLPVIMVPSWWNFSRSW